MRTKFLVIGAGIGGLATGGVLKKSRQEDFLIVEKSPRVPNNLTNGLHYLHDLQFNIPFMLEFKECILTENIWDTKTNQFSQSAMIPDLFSYSKKVMDNLRHPSSIMDPGKRTCVYVPESNNMNDLITGYENYIGKDHFMLGSQIDWINVEAKKAKIKDGEEIEYEYLINTMPMNLFYLVGSRAWEGKYDFKHKPLYITNYTSKNIVANWMIVLYMSDPKFPPYRITCFNNIISMESLTPLTHDDEIIIKYLIGELFDYDLESVQKYTWETGRIFGLNKFQRKEILQELVPHGIIPIGRFGLWNGKLRMDDTIIQAEAVVKTLIQLEIGKGKDVIQDSTYITQIINGLYE